MSPMRVDFVQDKKGMMWDVLLYIPTVTVLLTLAARFWFGQDANMAYLFGFLASFFTLAGANRVLKTRLMLLPTAPVALEILSGGVRLTLRNNQSLELLKNIRFFSDYAGRSFGLSGMGGDGRNQQFVFHKGQFPDGETYQRTLDKLRQLGSAPAA